MRYRLRSAGETGDVDSCRDTLEWIRPNLIGGYEERGANLLPQNGEDFHPGVSVGQNRKRLSGNQWIWKQSNDGHIRQYLSIIIFQYVKSSQRIAHHDFGFVYSK